MDILDNIIPYIPGEEAKIPAEARKILGSLKTDLTGFIDQPLRVSVACNRVPVLNGTSRKQKCTTHSPTSHPDAAALARRAG